VKQFTVRKLLGLRKEPFFVGFDIANIAGLGESDSCMALRTCQKINSEIN